MVYTEARSATTVGRILQKQYTKYRYKIVLYTINAITLNTINSIETSKVIWDKIGPTQSRKLIADPIILVVSTVQELPYSILLTVQYNYYHVYYKLRKFRLHQI